MSAKLANGWVLVTFWTVIGAALRFLGIGAQSLWLDELFSVFVARRDIGLVISGSAEGDTNPPLFNLLLHFPLQAGSDETAARLLSAIFGVVTIPLFYFFAMRLFRSLPITNIATLLLVTTPFQIAYAQEARMYAQLGFFQLGSIYLFHRAWIGGRRWDWLTFAATEALAFYTHSLAVLGLLAIDIFALWRWNELKRCWREVVIAHTLLAVLFAPWGFVVVYQTFRVVQGFWNPSSTLLNLLRTVYVLTFDTALPTILVPLGLLVTLLLFVLGLYSVSRAMLREHLPYAEQQSLQLVVAITLVPPTALLALSLIRPLYIERVLISASFGLLLLWSWVWAKRPRRFDRAVLAVGAILLAVALGHYYTDPVSQKPPMRDAASALVQRWQPGEPVVHTSDWTALAFDYYLPEVPQHFLAGDPVYGNATTRSASGLVAGLKPEDRTAAVGEQARAWLVVALDHSEEYQQARVNEFNTLYQLADEIEVRGVYLMLYQTK